MELDQPRLHICGSAGFKINYAVERRKNQPFQYRAELLRVIKRQHSFMFAELRILYFFIKQATVNGSCIFKMRFQPVKMIVVMRIILVGEDDRTKQRLKSVKDLIPP